MPLVEIPTKAPGDKLHASHMNDIKNNLDILGKGVLMHKDENEMDILIGTLALPNATAHYNLDGTTTPTSPFDYTGEFTGQPILVSFTIGNLVTGFVSSNYSLLGVYWQDDVRTYFSDTLPVSWGTYGGRAFTFTRIIPPREGRTYLRPKLYVVSGHTWTLNTQNASSYIIMEL
jgi:hypothetical protein